ncbi:hypothetical protein K0M31_008710 [Melipona bicolor]|uniref:Uncharacterized protein n=1 Tax=Melipona bicolor TaxID=60889 RepID=A0AA40KJU4_9HYME|nr:hypothetical protein K0M31_008710 [Melipona bicolor]
MVLEIQKSYSLRNLKFKGEAASVDKSAAEKFLPQIAQIIKENEYVPDQNIALTLSDIKHSILNACWKTIWPQVLGNKVPITNEGITSIMNLSQKFEKEGFGNLNESDINDLLDRELIGIDT